MVTSESYQCADGTGGDVEEKNGRCCPSSDPMYGWQPYHTIYDKDCPCMKNGTTCDNTCSHVDIPWTLACDAARGPQYIAAFLARPCKDNEGSLLRHNNMDHHWGCSYKPSAPEANASKAMTNKDALLAMTNNTYLFGVNNSDGVFKSVPDDKVCKQAGLEGATCGYFTSTATGLLSGGGCHYNMVLSCLSATGFVVTFLCTYVGFACLITGSLWNAKLLEKLSKARAQWSQLRSPPASSKLGSDGQPCST